MITGAEFLLGIVGNLAARHIDPAVRPLAEVIFDRLRRGGTSLPPNHDVDRVCRAATRQSLEMLAQALELSVYRPKTLVEAIGNRREEDGTRKPLLKWWHTDEGEWFDVFVRETRSDDALGTFSLRPLANAPSMDQPVRGLPDAELEEHFRDAVFDWIERRVQKGKRPAALDEYVRDGWPVDTLSPGVRVTFYRAWCLFLQDHIKKDEKVFRMLTADWLASIDARLTALSSAGDGIAAELRAALEERAEPLVELNASVGKILGEVGSLAVGQGELLLLAAEYRKELGDGLAELRMLVARTGDRLATIDETTARSDQKLDAVLDHEQAIIGKLDLLLARVDRPEASRVPTSATVRPTELIDESRLLESDGAARFERLIGRSREKAMLSRAWKDEDTAVVSVVAWGGVGKTSLVIDWLADFVAGRWAGVDAFFDWSFYSQGTKDQSSANGEQFISAALRHFRDPATADGGLPAEEKARRLADLIRSQRTLLILDGLEPLQHPRRPGQAEGRLKDGGVYRLLQSLAQSGQPGLCVLTTREPVVDLKRYHGISVKEHHLLQLSVLDSAKLLHLAGARFAGTAEIREDDDELLAAAKELRGHPLSLQLLGGYLRNYGGDIRQRDRVDLHRAFEGQLEGHVFNLMAAYEEWFQAEGDRGRRQLSALGMLGLFDRPADAGCLRQLRRGPVLAGINDGLVGMTEAEWSETVTRLADRRLVYADRSTGALDAHPLIRAYFATSLRAQYAASWRTAHQRLYEYLRDTTREGDRPSLAALDPLYRAVWHGCQAGLARDVVKSVYRDRIARGTHSRTGFHSTRVLGAYGADLGAVACFFESPWSKVDPALDHEQSGWVLSVASFNLAALGRLTEALEPMQAGLEARLRSKDWSNAAKSSFTLSDLFTKLGDLASALRHARNARKYARLSGQMPLGMLASLTIAQSAHSLGHSEQALAGFREVEAALRELSSSPVWLDSYSGYNYCDLLLEDADRAALRATSTHLRSGDSPVRVPSGAAAFVASLAEVEQRASTLVVRRANPLDQALKHLLLARIGLYRYLLVEAESTSLIDATRELALSLNEFRRAGRMDETPQGLLVSAWIRRVAGDNDGAREDLEEVWAIAERGPMPLFQADVLLYRARLFHLADPYPWRESSPRADLAEARRLIAKHGYGRRLPELEDAERAIKHNGPPTTADGS